VWYRRSRIRNCAGAGADYAARLTPLVSRLRRELGGLARHLASARNQMQAGASIHTVLCGWHRSPLLARGAQGWAQGGASAEANK
jgi:hypothetical protein